MERVKFCLIGAGRAGMVHARNIIENVPSADLVCIVEPNVDAARKISLETGVTRCYSSLEDAIRNVDFDAVIIATPTYTHAELTKIAASAGKHVFCEKPMALNLKEAEEMIQACKDNNVKLQIGFMRRFDDSFLRAKEAIENREIGEVILVKSTGRGPHLPPRWACNPKISMGMLAEVNSHDFDSIRWLTNSEFSKVYAEAGTFKCFELSREFPSFYDSAIVLLRLKNGVLGIVDGSCPVNYGYDARVEILGTEGAIFIGGLQETMLTICTREYRMVMPIFQSWRTRFKDAYVREIRHFVDCILEDREPTVTGEDGKKIVEVVLAATKSILSGEPIKLPLQGDIELF